MAKAKAKRLGLRKSPMTGEKKSSPKAIFLKIFLMIKILWSLFLTGIVLGSGPCLFSCGPLLVSYIAATKDSARGGFRTYLVFSIVRILVYGVFGLLCGIFGEIVLHRFFQGGQLRILFFIFGLFLLFIGYLLAAAKFPFGRRYCFFVHKHFEKNDFKNIMLFSLIVALAPCAPLLAVMGYIILISDQWFKGVVYMAFFGLGTIISPMVIFSVGAGYLVEFLQKKEKILRFLRIISGLIICFLGGYFIYTSIIHY